MLSDFIFCLIIYYLISRWSIIPGNLESALIETGPKNIFLASIIRLIAIIAKKVPVIVTAGPQLVPCTKFSLLLSYSSKKSCGGSFSLNNSLLAYFDLNNLLYMVLNS